MIELWGGIECTVNRVGDQFFDQIERSGHGRRLEDLDLLADLGIKALRYPVLWERHAAESLDQISWSWADERLGRMSELKMLPIVGLVHHGSGPSHTSLVDPGFAPGLAAYAGAVAARYPWVDAYTPVNEPLTTARFSGLYGLWYPHGTDDQTFVRALINECRGVVLAMEAIRAVNPQARLVQTDDLGKAFGTPPLADEIAFQNERRWLTFDLLCGYIDRSHPLWGYLLRAGASVDELNWFREHMCKPDIIGINSYLTSQRFLDHRLDRYPEHGRVHHGAQNYVDVAAVHVLADGPLGHAELLAEAWERYRLPLAITEVHNGSTREEQLRWLAEVWDAAHAARDAGVDVRGVTPWALLGTYDWHCLVTRDEGFYEPGVFDLRGPRPRPTALAAMLRDMAAGRRLDHPVLDTQGWWRRPVRFCFGDDLDGDAAVHNAAVPEPTSTPRSLLIVGAAGTLGSAFVRLCAARGLAAIPVTQQELDCSDPVAVVEALDRLRPWAVVYAAGYVGVDDAESDQEPCCSENVAGPALLARECALRGVGLLTFSSDLVFDGDQQVPYVESDPVAPLNVYGRSKAEAERQVLQAMPDALVVRTSAFFGPWDQHNFVAVTLRALAAGQLVYAADDLTITATYVPDLVHTCLDLLIDGEGGVWHLANSGALTWAELARRVARLAGYGHEAVVGTSDASGLAARQPRYSALSSERGTLMPPLNAALGQYFQQCESLPLQSAEMGRE